MTDEARVTAVTVNANIDSNNTGTTNANDTAIMIMGGGVVTTGATLTLGFGGTTDSLWVQQA